MLITESWLKERFIRKNEEHYNYRLALNYYNTAAYIEARKKGQTWFAYLTINGYIASNSITDTEGIEALRKAILNMPNIEPMPVINANSVVKHQNWGMK